MRKFLAKVCVCAALLGVTLIAVLAVRTALWEDRLAAALSIRESTHTLCVGNSHTGCTWEDSETNGVQVIWKSACTIPFAWMRLAEIERRGGFRNVKRLFVDCDMPELGVDPKRIAEEMATQWPLAWRYAWRTSGLSGLRAALMPIAAEWVVRVDAPTDARCWTDLAPEKRVEEVSGIYGAASTAKTEDEIMTILGYYARIREIAVRNGLELHLFLAPLPSDNPQRTLLFLDEWIARLRSLGYMVHDYRAVCPDSDFRDCHHLSYRGRVKFTADNR